MKALNLYRTLIFQEKIGVTGFEPATSRPPAVRSSQAEPYPVTKVLYHKLYNKATEKSLKSFDFTRNDYII